MSQKHLNERLQALVASGEVESLEERVLRTFCGHPTMVGSPSVGCSRPLDLGQSDDLALFMGSVQAKFDRLTHELGFLKKEEAHKYFEAGWELFFQKS